MRKSEPEDVALLIQLRFQHSLLRSLLPLASLCFVFFSEAPGQEYYYDSYQLTNLHRFDNEGTELMGGSWGHHLGHMVRTATQGLWYVDDGGRDVWVNSSINYYHFNGDSWIPTKTLLPPQWTQQNFATIAVGDSIFSYAANLWTGAIDEAFFDTRTHTCGFNRSIAVAGSTPNYIGAVVSPAGVRVVWWTLANNPVGPSSWCYIYNTGGEWSDKIGSSIAGADFSYVFASFLDDSTFYVGGEVPKGWGPYTYEVGAGRIVLGRPLEEFTKLAGTAADGIWVNRTNGDVHLVCYGSFGNFGYYYKPAGGAWGATVEDVDNLGGVGKSRLVDSPDGNLYVLISGHGFRMMSIPKSSVTGKIDFSSYDLVSLGGPEGYSNSFAIWAESPEFQTAAVNGINFASPGNDWDYANLLRHTSANVNQGNVFLRLSWPNGHEVLKGGIRHTISWYPGAGSSIDTVGIELSTDEGVTWSIVEAKAPNTGSCRWNVPMLSRANCRIRIYAASDGSKADTTNASFSIIYTPLKSPTATINCPTKDSSVVSGSTMTFEGTGTDTDGYIVNYVWQTGDGRTLKGPSKKFIHTIHGSGSLQRNTPGAGQRYPLERAGHGAHHRTGQQRNPGAGRDSQET